jgi:hypothetical protein
LSQSIESGLIPIGGMGIGGGGGGGGARFSFFTDNWIFFFTILVTNVSCGGDECPHFEGGRLLTSDWGRAILMYQQSRA